MEIIQIKAETRSAVGKKAAKALRNQGKIPAVLYSKHGVSHFTTTHNEVKSMVFTPDFKLAEIDLEGSTHKALLKEIIFHPVTDEIQHMDFLELVEGHTLKATIPVKTQGVSPGVKGGGILIRSLRSVKVKSTPETLVDTLYVSIEELELGSAVRVKDIEVPEGIQVMVNEATPIASVVVPRALKTEEEELEEAAAAAAAAEGEGEEQTEGEGDAE